MLQAALWFFVIGLVAFVLGAGGIAGISIEIGRLFLGVFLALAVIAFVVGMINGKTPKILN